MPYVSLNVSLTTQFDVASTYVSIRSIKRVKSSWLMMKSAISRDKLYVELIQKRDMHVHSRNLKRCHLRATISTLTADEPLLNAIFGSKPLTEA